MVTLPVVDVTKKQAPKHRRERTMLDIDNEDIARSTNINFENPTEKLVNY